MATERYFALTNVKAADGKEITGWRSPYGGNGEPTRAEALAIADEHAGQIVAQGDYEHIAVLDVEVQYFAAQVSSHRRPS